MLFLLIIDFVMHQATYDPRHLTDLDFAYNLALLSQTAKSLQSMTGKYSSQIRSGDQ